ncbi:hypothetical protein J7E73_31325 [Paenibacillus albidus]|uniref:hypothetical protein n=1 Tax=Paenibacillus albidus TaxID=2041023 RepID=UPI001BE657EA|nr:hypothetical protein [Paenibacillus albidus]MBT2293504.1 hypothetical protein [Paenibacillus albidus]
MNACSHGLRGGRGGYYRFIGDISVVTKQKAVVERIGINTGIGQAKAGVGNGGLFGTAKELAVGLAMVPDSAVAAGPAAPKLAGAALGEEPQVDGLAVSLIGIGIPKADAIAYAQHAGQENIIVIVILTGENSRQADDLFKAHHAIPLRSSEMD